MAKYETVSISTVYGKDYDMEHVGYVIDPMGYAFPVFESEYGYQIDLGGTVGLSDPIEATCADDAMALFEVALA